jgi:hypothetical protein
MVNSLGCRLLREPMKLYFCWSGLDTPRPFSGMSRLAAPMPYISVCNMPLETLYQCNEDDRQRAPSVRKTGCARASEEERYQPVDFPICLPTRDRLQVRVKP